MWRLTTGGERRQPSPTFSMLLSWFLRQVSGDVPGRCEEEAGHAVVMAQRDAKPCQPRRGPERPLKPAEDPMVPTGRDHLGYGKLCRRPLAKARSNCSSKRRERSSAPTKGILVAAVHRPVVMSS